MHAKQNSDSQVQIFSCQQRMKVYTNMRTTVHAGAVESVIYYNSGPSL